VVKIYLDRFERMVGVPREKILDRLPYLGLDIEGTDDESVRLEYNPNRPDFSTDVGIARALKGILAIQTGLPKYHVSPGKVVVHADRNLPKVRPFITCAVARKLSLDDETIRQLISMQEDLHNGLGRKRRKVSIGLHNLDVVSQPIHYEAVKPEFAFTPLGETRKMDLREILTKTKTGEAYGHILSGAGAYPLLRDSKGTVLSFPPIINGVATKVDTKTKNMFIDVTSTDGEAGDDVLAILAATLADTGASLESVAVLYPKRGRVTPEMSPRKTRLEKERIRNLTGLELATPQIKTCLRKSRLDLVESTVWIPRYRVDILHPADIAEEVAIGYGLDRIDPLYPPSSEPGTLDAGMTAENKLGQLMTQSGFIETMNYELVDRVLLYKKFGRPPESVIEVQDSRSIDHSVLRDSLIPSLMAILGRDIKEEYPQRIFEVGKVYQRSGQEIEEHTYLTALTAHSSATFSEAKMYLDALIKSYIGAEIETKAAGHWSFAKGRSAGVFLNGIQLGLIGEVAPFAIASFGLEVPVSGFEIDLSKITELDQIANIRPQSLEPKTASVRRHAKRPAAKAAML
jgi:phenylalanyl-tRNA synthetase beta chain